MKKTYVIIVLLLVFSFANSQNKNIIKEGQSRQELIQFSKSISIENSIVEFKSIYKLDDNTTFKSISKNVDKRNVTHEKFQQYYKNIKVEFGTIIVHHSNGYVKLINGELYNPISSNLSVGLEKTTAFNYAKNFIAADAYLWEDASQAKIMNYEKPKGETVLFPNVKTGEVKMAYYFDVYATAPISRDIIYVDANTGEILHKNPIIKHANRLISSDEQRKVNKAFESSILYVTGSADTRYNNNQNIETSVVGANFALKDDTRGMGINTYNCERSDQYQDVNFLDNDNNWTAAEYDNANKDNGALDAHWGAEVTYDFWSLLFNRNSFDDAGAAINSYVHYDDVPGGAGYDNAFWNGQVMTYGDGSGFFDILTSLDVCGHEIGHAICTFTANLAYQNQSGAMNEGFSDIWGACIEQYGTTGALTGSINNNVWLIGEDLRGGGLRAMNNPIPYGDPNTYLGTNWRPTGDEGGCVPNGNANDHCGVHSNSGVLNFWFYILTQGDSGTNNAPSPDNYNVAGIGMQKASEIAYLLERDYLTPNSTLADARDFSIILASELYCPASPEVMAVTNAWFAVNVGDEFVNVAKDVALLNVPENINVDCSAVLSTEISFINGGTTNLTSVDISYSLDGGSPVTEIWTGNLAICQTETYALNIGTLSRGTHTLDIITNTLSDGRVFNNSKSVLVIVNDAGILNTTNTFSTPADNLVVYNRGENVSLWERGIASGNNLSNAAAMNSEVYATNLSGIHGNNIIAYLVSQCYDLSNISTPELSFDMAFDIEEDWDILYMQYSTDGGTAWNILGTAADPDWYNNSRFSNGSDCFNCVGAQWTGEARDASTHSSGGLNRTMHRFSYNLSPFARAGSAESNIIFRFVYQADQGFANEGAIIDNFQISGLLSVSENDLSNNSIELYPNPTNGLVTISNITSDAKIAIMDISGRVINANMSYKLNNNSATVNLSNLSTGAYFITITQDNLKVVKRVLKQ